ncbi:MAG TPA: NAD(P)-binding domain-containing protein [Williamwhitmania sp.]|nr:NAD(P)-binding domain-containing protein [Williamwhitmania sp.]
MKKVGIVGSGIVATTLAKGLLKHGYSVMVGSRDAAKRETIKKETGAEVGDFKEVAAFGELVILAVKGIVAETVIKLISDRLNGKTVIDTTNPIDEKPPVNGVLLFFTTNGDSLMERLQELAPKANFVKAFNSVGSAHMVNPQFDGKPTMFICGNSESAKKEVTSLLDKFGWETEDMGTAEAARAIEPLCMLWCIPGFRENRWNHAFKLLKTK